MKQIFSLNLIRAVAIILVMIDHGISSSHTPDWLYSLLRVLLSPDAVLFFMVSGALLMPLKTDPKEFLYKRLTRVFVPFVVWSIIYAIANYYLFTDNINFLAMQIRWSWTNLNFSGAWFVPVICATYLIMPILSPWVKTAGREQWRYFFIVWIISGIAPWLIGACGMDPQYNIFVTFCCYTPYFLGGWYLAHQVRPVTHLLRRPLPGVKVRPLSRKVGLMLCAVVVALIALTIIVDLKATTLDTRKIIDPSLSITSIVIAIAIFASLCRVRTLGLRLNRVVNFVARMSYGMYLSHFLVDMLLHHYCPEIAQTNLLILINLTLPLLLTWLLSRLPLFRRLLA